jgi:hypothetical protein
MGRSSAVRKTEGISDIAPRFRLFASNSRLRVSDSEIFDQTIRRKTILAAIARHHYAYGGGHSAQAWSRRSYISEVPSSTSLDVHHLSGKPRTIHWPLDAKRRSAVANQPVCSLNRSPSISATRRMPEIQMSASC